MSLLAKFRHRQTPWAQRVLGLFVVVWLSIALQPCAMAFGNTYQLDVEVCPHGMSEEVSPAGEQYSRDEVSQEERCNITGAQCAFLDDYNYDGRTVQIKVKHAPSDVSLGLAQSIATMALPNGVPNISGADDPTSRTGIRPQLNLLFCVFQI